MSYVLESKDARRLECDCLLIALSHPWILDPWNPFSQLIGRRTKKGTNQSSLFERHF